MATLQTNPLLEFVRYREKKARSFIPLYEPTITEEMRQAVLQGFDEKLWIRGSREWDSQGKKFEDEMCQFAGCKYAVNMTSGTAALFLGLRAWGVGPGDEVITVPNTFPCPSDAIMWNGAKPVYVDIDPETYCIDVSKIEDAITPRTRAIMPIDAHGHPADMDPIMEIAARHNLKVYDDSCQAIGAMYKGKKIGPHAHCGAYSYTRNKPMFCGGDGGILVTNDKALAETVWMLANHGRGPQYYVGTKAEVAYCALEHEISGLNFRQSEVLSAVARVTLRSLQGWNERRREIAARYKTKISRIDTDITLPAEKPYAWHSYWRFVIRTPQRDRLRLFLASTVETKPTYGTPNHLDRVLRTKYGYKPGDFPVTEQYTQDNLALPMYPDLTDDDVDFVVERIDAFYRGKK
ncbi:MAG: DegT/DnrJ/EryC1/StrS family aminotransferase [Armatimonadetes bacterium]|nr:DegT/DnrJ/EryC1/StrS family aminotransferase [Armatimonadota bacterium]